MSCYNTHIEMCCRESACDTLELKENISCYYNVHTKTLDCKGKIKCFSPGKCSLLVIPSSLIMFILASSAVLYLQIQKVEKMFQDESILMQYN